MRRCRFIKILNICDKKKSKFLKLNFSTSNKFEYSSPTALLNYNNSIPLYRNKTDNNINHVNNKETSCSVNNTFPCNNEEFFEMIKKNIKKNKNKYHLLNIYCKELMYRINDSNISAHIITKTFSLLSYTDYKNDYRISEILNRCILRLNEFDFIHLCSLIISLSKMNFKSVYFMEQVQNKFLREEENYFEKHSPHYICLFINSWVKLNCNRKKNYIKDDQKDNHDNMSDHMNNTIDHMNNTIDHHNNTIDHMNNTIDHMNNTIDHINNTVDHHNNNHINYLSHNHNEESVKNIQIINFLLTKISHKKVEEYSLIGISLLLYNISILKLHKYYYLFFLFENHIIKTKNHLNVIQIVNILTAYKNVCLLKVTLLIELLECINEKYESCSFHHLVRTMDVCFYFVASHNKDINHINNKDINHKNNKDINHINNKDIKDIHKNNTVDIHNNISSYKLQHICHFISILFNQLIKNTKHFKKKDVILLCGTLSKYKKWIDKNFRNSSSPLSSININLLFYIIRNNVKKFINLYSHVELSILLYCYSLYEINDLYLFHKIKLRCLKIFNTFNEITFSYLFKAFQNMKINDLIFENACLNKILEIKKIICPKSLVFILSALSCLNKNTEKKKKTNFIIKDILEVLFKNFQHIFINNFYEINKYGYIKQNINDSIPSYLLYIEEENKDRHSMNICRKKNETIFSYQKKKKKLINGDTLCMLVKLFSKFKEFHLIDKLIIILINEYKNYKTIISTYNCICLLNSMGNLCSHIEKKQSHFFWRNYYLFINHLTKKILLNVDLHENKNYLINFLSASGKIFHSYISILYIINEENRNFSFYLKNILDILITHLDKYINEFTLVDIGIILETFNKENYLQISNYNMPKEKKEKKKKMDDHINLSFVNKIINRLTYLLNHVINEKDYKNVIIIMNNIIKINSFDQTIYDLIIKNYILQSFYYQSIPMLSQCIYYICMNVLFRDIIINTQQIYLLTYLFKKLFQQFINQDIFLFSTQNQCLLISDKYINKNKINHNIIIDTIFIKSLIYLCQSIFIILFHISNIKQINYQDKIKKEVIQNQNNQLLNSITFLRLYLTIFMLTQKFIQEPYYLKKIIKFTHSDHNNNTIIEQIHNTIKHKPIKTYNTSLLFYKLLLIAT
ncbi:conserved Plasmodium protein, unknown function [Plasmodium sp. gorilla clade G2]|uniref:conserved Plasmodium protein, unknown function n=1 Tax=Plasmodium sp. gorilla clade G2 TaxID=880535 RepID=UPI000D212FD4|nr:conserved Plasmodium protein, unknown function [Plasmodium sp. gorilla clade G2]SOV17867.1 conserved Plasmodium protein, unknown function [Plasmodium sp. gorilla clade G2]